MRVTTCTLLMSLALGLAPLAAPTALAQSTVVEKTKEAGSKTKKAVKKAGSKTKDGLSKTGETITDGMITTRVKSKFVDEDLLKGSDIDVDTKDNVVTLTGTVTTAAGRARAIQQAKEVDGVKSVVSRLTIGPKK